MSGYSKKGIKAVVSQIREEIKADALAGSKTAQALIGLLKSDNSEYVNKGNALLCGIALTVIRGSK
jgi:hypothetical protein